MKGQGKVNSQGKVDLGPGFGTWIWDLDLGLGFETGLWLDKNKHYP